MPRGLKVHSRLGVRIKHTCQRCLILFKSARIPCIWHICRDFATCMLKTEPGVWQDYRHWQETSPFWTAISSFSNRVSMRLGDPICIELWLAHAHRSLLTMPMSTPKRFSRRGTIFLPSPSSSVAGFVGWSLLRCDILKRVIFFRCQYVYAIF